MLIPISTDAPIYHFPFATIGLIVTNVACFAATGFGIDDIHHPGILQFGTVNPLQWVSNMFFLWSFGLIVEGKLGWRRMLSVYLLIGISQSALIQLVMFFPGGTGAIGASSVITGLMCLCLVWAPKNEFHVILIVLLRVFSFDVSIMWYSLWYLFWDFLSWVGSGFAMGTAALHLSGAVIGFAVGTLYVKRQWVDCENWDLFAVLAGTHGRFGDPSTTVGSHADPSLLFGRDVNVTDIQVARDDSGRPRTRRDDDREMQQVQRLVDTGQVLAASEALMNLRLKSADAQLDETRLKRMGTGLLQAGAVDEAEIALEEYVERFADNAAWARLKLAQILLVERSQPTAALQNLKCVRLSQLSETQQKLGKKIAREARRQVRAGIQDAESEW